MDKVALGQVFSEYFGELSLTPPQETKKKKTACSLVFVVDYV
jgi:hypothetical protein